MNRVLAAAFVSASIGAAAYGDNVYMLTSTHGPTDTAAAAALTSRGHTVTVGVQYNAFDGTVNLAGYDAVYLQCNANWTMGLMPEAGQQQLIAWVNAGGNLVTSEWVVYYTYVGGKFGTLASIIPGEHSFDYDSFFSATYTQVTPDPVVNAGLPATFDFPLSDPGGIYGGGTETFTNAKAGATTYYSSSNSATGTAGLVGWAVGSGTVFSFLSTLGPDQTADAEFGLLFSNVIGFGGSAPCYPDCNQSGTLTIADFGCFQNAFVAQQPYGDCNNSATFTIADFACFQTAFVNGCP